MSGPTVSIARAFGLVTMASMGSWASHSETRSACHSPYGSRAGVGDAGSAPFDQGASVPDEHKLHRISVCSGR